MTTTQAVGHTPGPWTMRTCYTNGEPVEYAIEQNGPVATVHCTVENDAEDHANARLIAAAPAMLEALRTALVHLPGLVHPADVKQIRDAIAKAEGRTV
jgi:hypothetical protein